MDLPGIYRMKIKPMLQRHLHTAFPGTIHFVTTVTHERGNFFVRAQECEALLQVFEEFRAKGKVDCLGYVLMPDHFHALLHQVEEGAVIPSLMRDFKKRTAFRCRPAAYRDKTLWRTRYDDVSVPGTRAIHTKLHYIHENPVRRGIVEVPEDYPWSSAGDYFLDKPGIVTVIFFRVG